MPSPPGFSAPVASGSGNAAGGSFGGGGGGEAGRKVRSKTGCGTCKGRRKACDEQWDASGSCRRCIKAGYPCHKDTYKPPRRRRPRKPPTESVFEPPPALSTAATVAQAAPLPSPPPLPHAGIQDSSQTSAASIGLPSLALSPSSSLFAAFSDPIPPDLISDLLNTTSASANTATTSVAATNPDPLDVLSQAATEQGVAAENALGLDQFMAWLSSPPESIATEVSKFSSEWWGFYISIVDAFFYSIPSE
ncbi:hypothetical protein JCM6882_002439 [Rhodosporidiobolus microsporus]